MIVDPFDLALKNLKTAKPLVELGPRAEASVREGLQELADGMLRTVPAAEAGVDLRAAVQARRRQRVPRQSALPGRIVPC